MNSSKKYEQYVKNLEIRAKELESYLRGCHDVFDSVREYIPQELAVLIRRDFLAVFNQIAEIEQKVYTLSEQQTEQMKKDYERENLEQ